MLASFSQIQWQQPWYVLIALQPFVLWLAVSWLKSHHQQGFSDKHLLPWIRVENNKTIWQKFFSRDVAYSLAWIGFALALAGPRIPDKSYHNPNNTQHDVMLVMDLSRSMYATDIKPSRLRRAVLEAYEFLSIAKSLRVGVVVYAARPHLYVPFTHDINALRFYLKDVDSLALPTQGSDPVAAILFAQKALNKSSGSQKSIVWISDGDLTDEQIKALKKVRAAQDISLHTLAIATDENVSIPLADGSWLMQNGQGVITSSNLDGLATLIKTGGDVFSIVSDDESDWLKIYQQGILKDSTNAQTKQDEKWKPMMIWLLLPAFALLLVAYIPSAKVALVLIVVSALIVFNTANAEEIFLDQLLTGESSYKNEDYDSAKRVFIQAVLTAEQADDRAIALHNLGNALFKMGDYASATQLFSDALRYNPEQKQSTQNQKLSYELYKALQRRQRNQQMQGNLGTPNQTNSVQDLPDQMPQSANTQAVIISEYKLPKIPKETFDKLLKQGLTHLKLMQEHGDKNKQKLKLKQDINTAKLYLLGLGEQQKPSSSPLWKRLFEIEEGFPGDLDTAQQIPGLQPW